ncbi:porin [Burkholderia sp. 3C]
MLDYRTAILIPVLATPIMAQAQTSVTLYGILDEGVQINTNARRVVGGVNVGGRQVGLDATSGLNGSRWGLHGTEDLGSGMKAVFTLESGINLNTGQFGQGGTAFGRQAFVGIGSSRYGTVTLGRQYDMVVTAAAPAASVGYVAGPTFFSHPGDMDNLTNSLRTNNAIKYLSPTVSGFSFGATWSLGGVPGNVTGGGGYSAGVTYAQGPLNVGAGYVYFKNPTSTTAGAGLFTDNASGATSLSGLLNSNYATASAYQDAVAAVNYTVGNATLGLNWSNVQYGNIAALSGATAHFNIVDAGLKWRFSPTLLGGVAYSYTKGSDLVSGGRHYNNQHFNQLSMLLDYLLSKRTDVYVVAALQKASGVGSTGARAVADIGNIGDSSNDRQALFRIAMRHKF